MAHDTDAYVRWDAGQRLAANVLLGLVRDRAEGPQAEAIDPRLVSAFVASLERAGDDPALAARALSLPGSAYLGQQMPVIDVEGIRHAIDHVRDGLGLALRDRWLATYRANQQDGAYSIDTAAIGRRSLKNLALAYPTLARDPEAQSLAREQFAAADNMTDSLAALRLLVESEAPGFEQALANFYERWHSEPLVVNKWFALQAGIEDERAVERVEALIAHPAFGWSNPNRVRAVLGTFAAGNLLGFHRRDGAGYRLLTDRVFELDRLNPQVAARLASVLGRWRRFDAHRQGLMRGELQRIVDTPGLSRDVFEIASKSLA
jgi:aminopeptidase N